MLNDDLKQTLIMFENELKPLETKMKNILNDILNEIIENNKVKTIFFEYRHYNLGTRYKAVDDDGNILLERNQILPGEILGFTWLIKEHFDTEKNKNEQKFEKYGTRNEEFESDCIEFENRKNEIFEKWFQLRWKEVKAESNNIPKTYLLRLIKDFSAGKVMEI